VISPARNAEAKIPKDYLTDLVIAMEVLLMRLTQQVVPLAREEPVL